MLGLLFLVSFVFLCLSPVSFSEQGTAVGMHRYSDWHLWPSETILCAPRLHMTLRDVCCLATQTDDAR